MSLRAEQLTVGYGERDVLQGVDVPLPSGQITAIVGANACGKSTLLRTFARLLKPTAGTVLLDGAEIHTLPTREVAQRLGFLPQSPVPPEGLTVEDLVHRGRFPHQKLGRRTSAEDRAKVDWALTATGVEDLRARPLDQLSGGQRQRAWIAMALAQDTPTLLLDEPTTYLDLAHQLEVLDLLVDLNEQGRTIGIVLHDLNHACRYAHHLVAMKSGRVYAAGAPGEIVDETLVKQVFGLDSRVIPDPVTGTPMCVPIGRTVSKLREPA
ncbi:ABC transporter ATP-binding protein [Solirubrobacter sp. CPCC 204708]|uniref:ABC transporter ATP-binding protein n=1 Tax=Solirubrobacter deserti TaxID=2282478 RepID=A0ABT4RE29_9ACTN|nr:ABC transporter ATP-binding protein [Solirubrobacter deserti]MBE2314581.1 ABC transporter ATP-binding protein [Solirubrobacter deserti]MDA0136585.1 ABC transporter ATP-binding protein [Solirubrobacter deserti]